MGGAMSFAAAWLRLRLKLRRVSPVMLVALLLCALGFGALAWLLPARQQLEAERETARRAAALPPPTVAAVVVPSSAGENLARFQAALGSQRDVEPGVKTLFRLAAKSGLVLRQGEYKRGFDRNAQLHTYQVNLPVKGSYAQVWQFAFQALRAIPFASLDDLSFKRDAIGETAVEGRLRLTFYLHDAPGAAR
jgi:hypothetical protein